jgi:hypothetical protein
MRTCSTPSLGQTDHGFSSVLFVAKTYASQERPPTGGQNTISLGRDLAWFGVVEPAAQALNANESSSADR